MADQLRLDIQVQGGQQAQQQLAALAQQVQSFPSAAQGATAGAAQLGSAVAQAGQAASQAHPAYVSLGTVIGNLPGPLGHAGAAFASMTVQVTKAQEGMLALAGVSAAIGTGIAGGLAAAVGEAAQFQKTFAEVAVVSQASAEQMDVLRQKALALGASSTFNSQQVAAGMRELLQAGLTVTETLQGIEPATRAAMLAGQSLDQTTTMIAHTMRQFGMDAGQIPHIVDAMTVAAQASTLKFSEFGNLFENLRGRTQNLGIPFEEVTALLITMVNAGVPAAAASTALGTAMDRLGKATKTGMDEASQGIRALGLNVWDASGTFVGFTKLLDQIQAKLPTMTQEERVHAEALLGGSRASGAFNLTLQQQNKVMVDGQEVTLKGTDLIRAYTEQLIHADGVSQRASDTMGATLAVQWQKLNSSIQESSIQLGSSFIPALSAALPPVTALVNAFVNASPEVHQTAAALLAVGAATATMGGLVLGGTVAIQALGPAIALAATASAGILIPLAAVGVAVGLLAAAWINDWGNIRETTEAGVTVAAGLLAQFQADLEGVRQWLANNPLVITVQRVAEGQAGTQPDPDAARGTAERILADQQAVDAQLQAEQAQTISDITDFWARGFSQWGGTIHSGMEGLGIRLHDSGPSLGQSFANGLEEARFGEHLEAALTDDVVFTRLIAAANRIGDALAPPLAEAVDTAVNNPVIHAAFTDWGAKVAGEVGAALQANKGNVQKAITDLLSVEPNAGLQDLGVAQILERANALKATEQILNTLTPAERAHYEIQLLANGADDKANQALRVLNDMRAAGTITEEQYTNAIARGSVGLEKQTTAHVAVKSALDQHTEAARADALAIRDHQEALDRERLAALGGSLAVQQHTEALERERLAELQASGAADEQIAKRTAGAAVTRTYQTTLKGLTDSQRDYYQAVAGVLGEEEALNRMRANGISMLNGLSEAAQRLLQTEQEAARKAATPVQPSKPGEVGRYGATGYHGPSGSGEYAPPTGTATPDMGAFSTAGLTQMGAQMAHGFRENLGSGPVELGREIGGGFGDVARQVGPSLAQQIDNLLNSAAWTQGRHGAPGGPPSVASLGGDGQFAQYTNAQREQIRLAIEAMETQVWEATREGITDIGSKGHQSALDPRGSASEVVVFGEAGSQAAGPVQQLTAATTAAGAAARTAGQAFDGASGAVNDMSGAFGLAVRNVGLTAEQFQQADMAIRRATASALLAGQALTGFGRTATGLTYGQIYGNTATQGTGSTGLVGTLGTPGAVQNLLPGNYYGVPVTGPITAGTLRGYATGGPIDRPTILVDQASMRPYARAGEAGPEWVGPRGGGVALSVHVTVNGADALRDTRLWEQLADRQIVPVLRKRGLVT